MILFPYRAQIKLHKWPVMTIAVSIVCLLIYAAQAGSEARMVRHVENTCQLADAATDTRLELDAVEAGAAEVERARPWPCEQAIWHIHYMMHASETREQHLDEHARDLTERGRAADAERLRAAYRLFAANAPVTLTERLWHDRSRLDPLGMLTSSFAHASWEHVIFNLIFFFAFAAAVELILGPVLFLGMIVALSFGIGGFDYVISQWQGETGPSLGLSGVVMGMLALFFYFLPRARIRFFYWFLLFFGAFGVPAWAVALYYVGWDLYYQLSEVGSRTNFVAHLAGAAFGLALGMLLFRGKRAWAREIVEEKVDLTQDESWTTKLNAMVGSMMLIPMLVAGVVLAVAIVGYFVTSFWLQLLLIAPPLAAVYHLYRQRHGGPPVRNRLELGAQALARREYQQALRHLEPAARENDSRALYLLGELYATAPGVMRDEKRAIELYQRAAQRGHTRAQYALGVRLADGRGIGKDVPKAMEWYQKAALAGLPDAAQSLAYHYENGPTGIADKDKAIEWYYRAGVAFHKAGRAEDAAAIVRHLEHLANKYPVVLQGLAKLKAILAPTRESQERPSGRD